jgi:hypothetical protein
MSNAQKVLHEVLIDGVLTTVSLSNEHELATDAHENLSGLAEIFAQLNELFVSIDEATENKTALPTATLRRIKILAGLGRYMAVNWEQMAESMADRFSREIGLIEVSHE